MSSCSYPIVLGIKLFQSFEAGEVAASGQVRQLQYPLSQLPRRYRALRTEGWLPLNPLCRWVLMDV